MQSRSQHGGVPVALMIPCPERPHSCGKKVNKNDASLSVTLDILGCMLIIKIDAPVSSVRSENEELTCTCGRYVGRLHQAPRRRAPLPRGCMGAGGPEAISGQTGHSSGFGITRRLFLTCPGVSTLWNVQALHFPGSMVHLD